MNTLKNTQISPRCEICFRPEKTMLISGVKICAGCKSSYYRHNQKLLIFLLSQQLTLMKWSNITDLIHQFLTQNHSCGYFEKYMKSKNCTTIGNLKCKACKLVKVVLKLRKFPSNLNNFGWELQELINDNKERIFDDLVQRFGGGFDVKTPKMEKTVQNSKISKMVQISRENTLPQPNIHISVINYVCQSLNNSDKHFIFRTQQKNEPLISLDNSYHTGEHDPDTFRNQVYSNLNKQLKQQYNTCMDSTKQITVLLLEELFNDCGLPDIYRLVFLKCRYWVKKVILGHFGVN